MIIHIDAEVLWKCWSRDNHAFTFPINLRTWLETHPTVKGHDSWRYWSLTRDILNLFRVEMTKLCELSDALDQNILITHEWKVDVSFDSNYNNSGEFKVKRMI